MDMRRTRFMPPLAGHWSSGSWPSASRDARQRRTIALALKTGTAATRVARAVWWTIASLAAALAVAMLAPAASAQVFSSTPYVAAPDPAVEQLRLRLEALEGDLRKAIDQTENLGAQLSDARRVADQADAGRRRAEAELQLLRDRVETLEEIVNGQARPAGGTTTGNLTRGESVPNQLAAAPAPPPAAIDTATLPQDEEGLFNESHAMLIGGNFPGAEEAFGVLLQKYPKGKKAADAQYYLGEALLYQDNYADAAVAYGKLIKDHPTSSNAPTGLVKLARAMRLMDKGKEACRTLDLMSKQFPKASAVAKQMAAQERQYAKCA
jgi:tol-pal system protein YbgF